MIEKVTKSVWYGDEVWQVPGTEYFLSDANIKELETLAQEPISFELGCEPTPLTSFTNVFAAARDHLEHGPGLFKITGLPVTQFSETQLERIFWTVARQLGTPRSQSAKGELIYAVRDEKVAPGMPAARGPNTKMALSFHSDRCDVIGFLCVRQSAQGGENLVVSSAALHNALLEKDPELLATLYEPFYWKRHSIDTGNEKPWCLLPIFGKEAGNLMANIMRVLIYRAHSSEALPDLSEKQQAALDLLEETARDPKLHVRFKQGPGEMLFLNNFVVLHSRTAFEDEGAGRLLYRVWLSMPNSRQLPEAYAALYGNHRAGQLRGGIHPPTS